MIGLAAACCTTAAFVPQLLRSVRTRRLDDISLGMYVVMVTGNGLWLTYGFFRRDLPLVLANGVTLTFTLTILVLKLRSGR